MVEEFGLGLPPRLFGIKRGETLYSLNWLPFGGFVKVLGEEEHELENTKIDPKLLPRTFAKKKPWQKAVIVSAGVFFNFILGWVLISYLFTQGVPVPTEHITVEQVSTGSPAQIAGLQKNDEILSIAKGTETTSLTDPQQLVTLATKYAGEPITLEVQRQKEKFKTTLTPRKSPPKGEGSLGLTITSVITKKYSLLQAPFYGLYEAGKITLLTARELGKTLFHLLTLQPIGVDVAGPVGIAKLTGTVAALGINPLLQLVSILSLNLAVINILPFPALDGGRLAFIIYEMVTGRVVNPKLERRLNMAGFAVLLSLIFLITLRDIANLL